MIKPIHDSILFQFLNKRSNNKGLFEEETKSGIKIFSNEKDSSENPRWATAIYCGSECIDVVPGDYILIAPLRWTESIKYDGQDWSRTTENEVMCISKERPSQLY